MYNVTQNITQHIYQVTVTEQGTSYTVGYTAQGVDYSVAMEQQIRMLPDITMEARLAVLEGLAPIIQREDVVLGNLETVTMPAGNPNIIGMVQQIDEADGNKVYYPNFTTANNGRSAIFYSVLTQLENKIVIWPRPLEI
jgi:hypothetical protein